MAWTTMHFAVGMGCAGAAASLGCAVLRRGWRWVPGVMTLGGLWALVPDMPRIFREDFYWEPVSRVLGTHPLERFLHAWGDLFFFHQQLDNQPKEYALLGFAIIVLLYNASIVLLMRFENRHRNSLANRAWRAHRSRQASQARRRRAMARHRGRGNAGATGQRQPSGNDPAVICRIGPGGKPLPTEDPLTA